jgi:thiol-disulfide isomerase/thioredoxin
MKKALLFSLLMVLVCTGCRSKKVLVESLPKAEQAGDKSGKTDFSEQSSWILGYFEPKRLAQQPYSEWYLKGYDDYRPDMAVIEKLSDIDKDGLSLKIVMGTWCPDSRREVPRFMKVLDLWNFPVTNVAFIGVDNAKLSPVGEYDSLDIKRVPTFIIYKNKVEAGRIIENPVASLEQDLMNILIKNRN